MRLDQSGFVLVVTLLVLAVVVGAFVTSAAVNMVGARRSASFERVAYQALRVAENAVNTFTPRVVGAGYTGAFSADALDEWIVAEERDDLYIYTDAAGTAQIVLRDAGPSTVTIVATATLPGGVKTVLRDVERAAGEPLSPGALAPLSSVPPIDIRGNAVVAGQSYLTSDGTLDLGGILAIPAPVFHEAGQVTVSVANGVFLRPGFHVDIGGSRFRVVEIDGTTPADVRLLEVYPTAASVATLDDAAALIGVEALSIPLAVGSTVESFVPTATTVAIHAPNAVRVGNCVRLDLAFNGNDNLYIAEVTTVDESGPTATLNFQSSACPSTTTAVPPPPIPAGAALVRDVVSAESAAEITSHKPGETMPDGYTQDSTWLGQFEPGGEDPMAPDRLFEDVFGMTKAQFIALAGRQGTVTDIARKDVKYEGITYVSSGADNKSFCGTGVIVIDGDVQFTAGGPAMGGACSGETGFTGIVYIVGDFAHQGNSEFVGSVVVQGTTYIDDTTLTIGDDTDVRGTGDKVSYDLGAILAASALIPTSGEAAYVVGTWRQE